MTVSQYVARTLKMHGIETVFELSGGMIMHLLDAIHQEGGIDIVNVHHEQAAAFAADATGRLSGKPGVAFGTSGPGAINLLTGIGSSFFDSSPAIFITGQVNRHEQKGARRIRQLGFQETDIVSMARPITKFATRVTEPSQILELLPKAFSIATSGRPGAVLLDIPMDVFRATLPTQAATADPEEQSRLVADETMEKIRALVAAVAAAKRPLILAGAGVRAARARDAFQQFAEFLGVPVVHSLLACDVLPHEHPLRFGMIGTYGNRWANLAVSECDLLLVVGSRLDIRQTGADTESLARGRQIFHVEIEPDEINNRIKGCIGINMDVRDFFASVRAVDLLASPIPNHGAWRERIAGLRTDWPDVGELRGLTGINPNQFMHDLSRGRSVGAYCADVGLHQMWAAQSLELGQPTRFLTSGGMGAMGFALPAAVGAAFHFHKAHPVVVVAGDAGFQLNIQELQTIVHHRLPVKIVVMNNRCHGMTRQFQDTYFASRYVGTMWGYSTPDFAAVGRGYGLPAHRLSKPELTGEAIEWLWSDPLAPALLEVEIDFRTNAYPKLAFGKPISEMEPFAKPLEMEAT